MKLNNRTLSGSNLFALVLAGTCLPVSLQAQDFEYTITDDQVTIDKYLGDAQEVVIPSELEGFPVTSIGGLAFRENENLTSVTIPESVTFLWGFEFDGCSNLSAIFVDERNPVYSSDSDGVVFDKACKTLVLFPPGYMYHEYSIPDSTTSIGEYAFLSCTLARVDIPDSVTVIGDYAFGGWHNIGAVSIPASVTHIGIGGLTGVNAVFFLGRPPFTTLTSPPGPFWGAYSWHGYVFYLEGTPGWKNMETNNMRIATFDPNWLWGPYKYVHRGPGTFCNTGAWLGWLEVSNSPWVWHLDSGCCLYIEERVAAAESGWIYVPDLATDAAPLWLEMVQGTEYGWCHALKKWLYVPPGGLEIGSGWVYLTCW